MTATKTPIKIATFSVVIASLCAQTTAESEVRKLMANFVTAFENLDWPAFRQCWVENPVVFFPSPDMRPGGTRTDNASEFNAAWQRVFDQARQTMTKTGVSKAPFFSHQPGGPADRFSCSDGCGRDISPAWRRGNWPSNVRHCKNGCWLEDIASTRVEHGLSASELTSLNFANARRVSSQPLKAYFHRVLNAGTG
jgi:hypothetical protein